ncbi:MAG: sporulation protein [Paenibacillus sp.]|nr:sporulation protein [Paenibacillus sp.]
MLKFFVNRKSVVISAFLVLALMVGGLFTLYTNETEAATTYDAILYFPFNTYPLTGDHIRGAIAAGHSRICTIDRAGADANRAASLKGIPTKSGYDRDEWPMAMCDEGGAGASVRYVPYADNRGSGAWIGNQLEKYPNGTRIKFIMSYQ